MKRTIILLGFVLTIASCQSKPSAENAGAGDAQSAAVAGSSEYSLNASSVVNWKGSKPGGEHVGTVNVTEGKVGTEKGKVVSGNFTIDLNTIICNDLTDADMNGKLVGHLKSPDFFDVAKYPAAKFEIVSISELAASSAGGFQATHQVTGNLTMKDVTKSISFPAQIVVSDNLIKAESAPFALNRTEWGVNYGSKSIFAELKDNFIHDEMVITLNLSFGKVQ